MKKVYIQKILILLCAAMIWGGAFVAQSEGGDAIGPYAFCCIRSFMGSLVLLPVIALLDRLKLTKRKPTTMGEHKLLWIGGACCGVFLCFSSIFQQMGLFLGSSVGKAGFLTACYIVIVPIVGILLKKKCPARIWLAVLITIIGFYFLCIGERFSVEFSDLLILLCALMCALQILSVDHFAEHVDVVRMCSIQFLVSGFISFWPMLFFEVKPWAQDVTVWLQLFGTLEAWLPVLYAGILSNGVAYTFQCIGQTGINPTLASLVMSLESVFSVLAGWIFLGQSLTTREKLGCVIIFGALILAQLPEKQKVHDT